MPSCNTIVTNCVLISTSLAANPNLTGTNNCQFSVVNASVAAGTGWRIITNGTGSYNNIGSTALVGDGNRIVNYGTTVGTYYLTNLGGFSTWLVNAAGSYYNSSYSVIGGYINCMVACTNKPLDRNALFGARTRCDGPNRGATAAGYYLSLGRPRSYFNNIVKNSSTFAIKHPDPAKHETHQLVHTTVESPTAGDNMYRYQVTTINNKATLELPDYFRYLNKNEQVWITPKNHHGKAFGKVSADKKTIEITSDIDGDYQILIFATRKDAAACNGWRGVEMILPGATLNL